MKTIGFLRNAKKHKELLDPQTRSFFQKYLDGVNAFIKLRPKEQPLEFKLAGIKPTPWKIEDCLAVAYMRGGKVCWWFSDKAIEEHARTTLELMPQ